jgi:hypothetical protein
MKTHALTLLLILTAGVLQAGENWPQLQGNAQRSGNAADEVLQMPLGLVAAIPMSDAIQAAPVVAGG